MKHDEPVTMCSLESETMYSLEWLRHERARHGRKATRPAGKTRNAISRNIQAKPQYKEIIEIEKDGE